MEHIPESISVPKKKQSTLLPLSFSQERLWLRDQLDPGNPVHNLASAYRLRGHLDITCLRKSLNEIARRHATLRMVFSSESGIPILSVQPCAPLTLETIDLRDIPELQRESLIHTLLVERARLGFDLARGPLVRVVLLQLGIGDCILQVVMHSIISDDASLGILFQELTQLYSAYSNQNPSPLPELTRQYTDFSVWQREAAEGGHFEKQRTHWRRQLDDCPPNLQLATDYRGSPGKSYGESLTHEFLIPKSVSETLMSLSDQCEVPLFVLLLTAFQAFLYRYTGQDDLVVGVRTQGRSQLEFGPLIGHFAQSLPLRTSFSDDPDFYELVLRVDRTVTEGVRNQDLPWENVWQELQSTNGRSHEPIFRVLFEWRETQKMILESSQLKSEMYKFETGFIECDLTFDATVHPGGICCRFKYDREFFETSTIARMSGHFLSLLEQLASNPKLPVSRLSIISAAELHVLLNEWNGVKIEKSETAYSHELFEAQAALTPEAPAVIFQSEVLSYRDLDHRANQLAHYLQDLGVQPEVPVGICMDRSIGLVVTILAILKAGGACLPLNPSLPNDRLDLMVKAANCHFIVTEARHHERFGRARVCLVPIDTIQERLRQYKKEPPANALSEEYLANIFFTSGSTGNPKAVMWNHRKQSKAQNWAKTEFNLTAHDVHLMKSSIGFTPLNIEIFWPLLTGARLIIAPAGLDQDSALLVQFMAKHRITITNFVPSMLKVIIEEPEVDTLSSLRQVICFGEGLHAQVEKRFFEKLSAEMCVIYGATEAPSSTYRKCVRGKQPDGINIGRRLAGKQVYILDSRLNLVPIGVPGEICAGGDVLARGYLNRPDLTSERFIPNPFSIIPGTRLYRTGDRARFLSDGSLEFLGRIDQQVKIRGYRVEPAEIEAALAGHPAVRDSVVIMREAIPDEQHLVAYVVPDKVGILSIRELREFLRQKLPSYMLPSGYVFIDKMPLTTAGKLDRKALSAPIKARSESDVAYMAPRTPLEESLAKIWGEVLNTDRVGIQDNFFDLGGNSLLATQLASRVRKAFQVEIPLRTFFENPSVEGLALAIFEALTATMGPADITQFFS
ncbi:MAG TPA: amino acid adenylation domain-containing protein [Terriglobia bacterium]|nr:amino acid adenylation domain-containing protein [Terriglobia bacterium]